MILMPDLVPRIVSFLGGAERRAVGYDVATCVRLKLPPAPLSVAPAFLTKLTDLQQRRKSCSVYVYSHEDSKLVHIMRLENVRNVDERIMIHVLSNVTMQERVVGDAQENTVTFIPQNGQTVTIRWWKNGSLEVRKATSWISCERPLRTPRRCVV